MRLFERKTRFYHSFWGYSDKRVRVWKLLGITVWWRAL